MGVLVSKCPSESHLVQREEGVSVAGSGGGRPSPRPVAFDRQAPPGERADQGGAETTAQLVWILAPRLPEPEGVGQTDD